MHGDEGLVSDSHVAVAIDYHVGPYEDIVSDLNMAAPGFQDGAVAQFQGIPCLYTSALAAQKHKTDLGGALDFCIPSQ